MTLATRRLVVILVAAAILLIANAGAVLAWLNGVGLIPLAEHIQQEYLTGTSLAVLGALLILLPGRAVWAICVRRCLVCHSLLCRRGKYCAECGSRV